LLFLSLSLTSLLLLSFSIGIESVFLLLLLLSLTFSLLFGLLLLSSLHIEQLGQDCHEKSG
jgi:hypothetical protein